MTKKRRPGNHQVFVKKPPRGCWGRLFSGVSSERYPSYVPATASATTPLDGDDERGSLRARLLPARPRRGRPGRHADRPRPRLGRGPARGAGGAAARPASGPSSAPAACSRARGASSPASASHEGPVICYQGALVADLASGEWLRHVPMDGEAAAEVVRHVRVMDASSTRTSTTSCTWSRWTGGRAATRSTSRSASNRWTTWRRGRARPPTKFVLVSRPADVDAILPGLQERWRGRLYVMRSQPYYIEIADGSVSKSGDARVALRAPGCGARGGGVGDGMNDVDMLEWAGLGVAVAEAAEPVRAAADAGRAARRHPAAAQPAWPRRRHQKAKAAPGGVAPPSRGLGAGGIAPVLRPPDGTRVHWF